MVDDDRFLYLISPESVTTPEALDAFAGKLEEALATGHVAAFQLRLKNVPDDWIDRVFAVMALSPQHTFQVLTKRAERMREYFAGNGAYLRVLGDGVERELRNAGIRWHGDNVDRHSQAIAGATRWPLPNVWLGISAEDQARADERIPYLLATPAAVRFVSAEPLLGPVDLTQINRLDWVIAGGESGPGSRPMHPDWVRSLRDQCQAAGTAFFFKQCFRSSPKTRRSNKKRGAKSTRRA